MADRVTSVPALRGIALHSDRANEAAITAIGAGATDSSYNQAGPRPGQATISDTKSKLRPRLSGGQVLEIEVEVRTAGQPLRGGTGVVWRLASESAAADAWRDRAPANFLNNWIAALWSDSTDWFKYDLVVVPESQDLILLYGEDINDPGHSKTFDWTTKAWGAEVDVTVNPLAAAADQGTWDAVCGIPLPNNRILAYFLDNSAALNSWSSDDSGATWSVYSVPTPIGSTFTTAVRMRGAFYRSNIGLWVEDSTGGLSQLASNSLGTDFVAVGAVATFGSSINAAPLPGNGGICIAYLRDADNRPACRIIGTPYILFNQVTEVLIDASGATPCSDLAVEADGTGTLWAIGRVTATPDVLVVWFSADGGANWTKIEGTAGGDEHLVTTHDASTYPENLALRFCRAWSITAHNWSAAPGNEDGSIGTIWSAGWGSLSTGGSTAASRVGWGDDSAATVGATWFPIELPGDTHWTAGGTTAPTLESPGEMQYDLVAGTGFHRQLLTAGDPISCVFEAKVTAGTTQLTTLNCGGRFWFANGTIERIVEVRFGTSGAIRVWDVNGAAQIGADITIDISAFVQFYISLTNAGVVTAYRRPFDSRWTAGPAGSVTDGGAGIATSRIDLGSDNNHTSTQRWRLSNYRALAIGALGFTLGLITTPAGSYHVHGGTINIHPAPVPEIGETTRAAFLSADRGPGVQGEQYAIAPIYDFGVRHLFASDEESPAIPWRSDDLTQQEIVIDLGNPSRLGPIWHLLWGFLNCNVRTIDILSSVGAGFTLRGTYDSSVAVGVSYELNGDWIRPLAGSTSAAVFWERNSLSGGFVILDTGGAPLARLIDRNSAGGWQDPATAGLEPGIRLVGITGGEAASGTCNIMRPSGVFSFAYPAAPPARPAIFDRYWKIRVPVQDVVDSYYQIGTCFVGSANVFGKQWSRGWTRTYNPNTAREVSRRGTIRKQEDGPVARAWALGWPDTVVQALLRRGGVDPDYLAIASNRPAIAAFADVWGTLVALTQESGGWKTPALAFNDLPTADTASTTDTRRYLYGTGESAVQVVNVTGNENDNEVLRVPPIRIAELV